jgi:hypothetical protein
VGLHDTPAKLQRGLSAANFTTTRPVDQRINPVQAHHASLFFMFFFLRPSHESFISLLDSASSPPPKSPSVASMISSTS